MCYRHGASVPSSLFVLLYAQPSPPGDGKPRRFSIRTAIGVLYKHDTSEESQNTTELLARDLRRTERTLTLTFLRLQLKHALEGRPVFGIVTGIWQVEDVKRSWSSDVR